jgi:N4-gp56 family major capsid protein
MLKLIGRLLQFFFGLPAIVGAADTSFATGATETVKRWAARLWIELPREIYFGKFMREDDMNTLIEVKRDLEGQPGDKVTFTLLQKLAAAAVTGDSTLEGSEEAMAFYSDSVTLDQNRNAVRLAGRMSERRTAFNQRDSAKTLLKTWLAETIDNAVFTGMDLSPTTVLFGGSATSEATIDSTSKIAPQLVDRGIAKAKKITPKIWPVRVNGRDFYITLMHTDVAYDLRQDGTWNQAQREANERSPDNPIFSGALAFYNGAILHEHEKIPIFTNGGAGGNQPGAHNFFMGRQAGVFAWGAKPEWWEKEFDYGNKVGFAIGAIYAFKKAVFNAADHAFLRLTTYRTNN